MLRKKDGNFGKQLHQRNRALESFEEIANTYLKTSTTEGAKGKAASPAPSSGRRFPAWLPWLIAGLCVLGAILILLSRTYFNVTIEITPRSGAAAVPAPAGQRAAAPSTFRRGDNVLVRGGKVEHAIVARAYFSGDARNAGKVYSNEIVLANGEGRGAASYRLDLAKPVDMTGRTVGYAARSETPGAKLVLVLTDAANRGYRVEGEKLTSVSADWRTYRVRPRPPKDSLDLAAITSIRFEFGAATTGNPTETVISLKDIFLTKAKRFPWL